MTSTTMKAAIPVISVIDLVAIIAIIAVNDITVNGTLCPAVEGEKAPSFGEVAIRDSEVPGIFAA